jgi:hypothetical protein
MVVWFHGSGQINCCIYGHALAFCPRRCCADYNRFFTGSKFKPDAVHGGIQDGRAASLSGRSAEFSSAFDTKTF